MSERLRVVVSTLATVAAMAVLLVGPDVSAGGSANQNSAEQDSAEQDGTEQDRADSAGLGGG